jgi:outer membrane protein assembly factor BamB
MGVTWGWRIVIAAAAVITALALGVGHESTWELAPGKTISAPIGAAGAAFGDAVGMDGIHYGPLAFAVGAGRLVVADTYRQRLAWRYLRGGGWHYVPWPDSFVDEVVYWASDHSFLVVDNRLPGLYVWRSGRPRLIWRALPERRTSAAVWGVAAGTGPVADAEVVQIGRGGFRVEWIEVTRGGARLVGWRTFDMGAPHATGHGVFATHLPLDRFWLGPDGTVYAAGADGGATVNIYRPDGHVRSLALPVPARAVCRWLGVDDRGRLYALVADEGDRLMVFWADGGVAAERSVPAATLRAARYGAVTADGTVYVDTSTGDQLRITAWHWVRKDRIAWRW